MRCIDRLPTAHKKSLQPTQQQFRLKCLDYSVYIYKYKYSSTTIFKYKDAAIKQMYTKFRTLFRASHIKRHRIVLRTVTDAQQAKKI
jgi:hypothetical protein